MKPKNFPERKRQRQLTALRGIADKTQAGVSNFEIIAKLHERTSDDARAIRTKKDRSTSARFARAA